MSNMAEGYGVTIRRAAPNAAGDVWRAVGVRCLPPGENGDQHNIFFEALSEGGNKLRTGGLRILWTWNGRNEQNEPAPPAVLDKVPADRWGGDIALYVGQEVSVRLDDGKGTPSDIVAGLRSDQSIEDGNKIGHRSFEVIFQLAREGAQTSAGGGTGTSAGGGGTAAQAAARLHEIAAALSGAAGDLRRLADALSEPGARDRFMGEARG